MSTISSSTTSTTAYKVTADTTGTLVFQTGATPTTAMTLGTDQSVTFAGTPTYSGGTANGVAYLNGSKALTTGSALVFDGTNFSTTGTVGSTGNAAFGGGSVPVASGYQYGIGVGPNGLIGTRSAGNDYRLLIGTNSKLDGTYRSTSSQPTSVFTMDSGTTTITVYPAGTAGNAYGTATATTTFDASGNLLMGMAATVGGARMSVQPASGTGVGIETNGSSGYYPMWFQVGGAQKGYITTATGGTTYNTTSDYRLKENIQPMIGALAKVAQLKPCTYVWKETGDSGQGFIAHELAEIVPECVTGEKDGTFENGDPLYQGIDTSNLVATLTAAIQEQQALITQLQADVAALKGASA